jgi:hypothetical protein
MGSSSDEDDYYGPFRFTIIQDELPASSDDGSGLHSPVGGVFPRMPRVLQGGSESRTLLSSYLSPPSLSTFFPIKSGINMIHKLPLPRNLTLPKDLTKTVNNRYRSLMHD